MGLKAISVTLGRADREIVLGFYNEALDGFEVDDNNNIVDETKPIELYRFVVGLLILNISFYYGG